MRSVMSKASPDYLMDVTCGSKNVRNGSAAEISILPRGRTRPGVRFRPRADLATRLIYSAPPLMTAF